MSNIHGFRTSTKNWKLRFVTFVTFEARIGFTTYQYLAASNYLGIFGIFPIFSQHYLLGMVVELDIFSSNVLTNKNLMEELKNKMILR